MSEIEPGTVIAGKYRLVERVSGGGMGSLWRAHHLQLDAPVALKFMHDSLQGREDARARFELEAKAAAQLHSPHVVHMYDHGIDAESGMPFIAMEFLEGEDLAHLLRRVHRLSPDQASRICQQVCKGLDRAHELGIVHRDLKPANIFVCKPDEIVKILDFGIAKETGERRLVHGDNTRDSQVLGSPSYMSPEQTRGLKVDRRSDLWSLAVIMFGALTGRRLFQAGDVGDVMVRVCTEPVPRPSSLNRELGPAVDRFFARALDRSPDHRFQQATAFAEAFETALADAPARRDVDVSLELPAPSSSASKRAVPPSPSMSPHIHLRQQASGAGSLRGMRLALAVGVILAGAIILIAWSRPGDLTLGSIVDTIRYAVGAIAEAITGPDEQRTGEVDPAAPPSATAPSAAPSAQSTELSKEAREAWMVTSTHVRMKDIPKAVDSLARLLEVYPHAPVDKRNTFLDLAERAFARPDETSGRLAELMTASMGEHGPDLLFDLMATRSGARAADEARRLLADAAVRKRGSKDMQLAHAIHTAGKCGKKVHVLAAKNEGGFRALREIRALTSRCQRTEACCLKGDKAVLAVEAAIQARQ